ncbi:putative addiction module antidote protein [Cardiobacterium sp. AH-315-I02]|nr:putative addiction module antidote protein [Cardiobacterium sp. AH-315-I02]
MNIKTNEFNPVDMLQNDDEINAYLLACYEDDDPATFVTALGYLAKAHGMAETAKASGLNRESLYKTFNGKTQPRWDTIHRLLKVLNVRFTVVA